MKCDVLQDIRKRKRERERVRVRVKQEYKYKKEMYIWGNLIYISTDMQNTQGRTEKVQTYITRQSIRMCTYM